VSLSAIDNMLCWYRFPASVQLSAVDHSAILTCLNPKALFYDTTLDPLCLRASLAAALRAYPCLAGRIR
jgi:hypothetical protein